MTNPAKPDLIRHLEGENIGRFPVWMMRQAGRYMEEYRAIRARHSFWEMVTTPALAKEVSLLPLRALPVDAVIFFSDILTLPHGLGLPIELKESVGPVLAQPLATEREFAIFDDFDPGRHTPYVGEALRAIAAEMPAEKALLGFAGAPWTVACYLIEGKASRGFQKTLTWLHQDPASLRAALEHLAGATVEYLRAQIQAGAHAVQLFDTWVGTLPLRLFSEHYLPVLGALAEKIRGLGVPLIYYFKQAAHLTPALRGLPVDVYSVDSSLELIDWVERLGNKAALQGNLDPHLLLTDAARVRRATRDLVRVARDLPRPTILNLGHGILKETPVENARAFVEEAGTSWT